MKRKGLRLFIFFAILCSVIIIIISSCSSADKKTALKVIIIPKFEIDEMTGDFPGEAQLFYEKYCEGCEETDIPHMPPTGHFYVNEENGVGLLITGSGKTAAGLSLSAVLSSDLYDYSEAYIVSVGCGGGSETYCTLGDVILETAVCDYDLGHHVDAHEKTKSNSRVMWFPDDAYEEYECKFYNVELCEKVFKMIKDCPLRTTEMAKNVIKENFKARYESDILPFVKKGTALTGDNFWKGIYGHVTASYIASHYECPDPYAVTEMEDVAIANTAVCYDMFDRLIALRVIVNMDIFLDGETPESTWGEYDSYNNKVKEENSETLDIFEPAMYNLFDTGSIVIDSILDGTIGE
jgi:purine nucleoside permease